MSDPDRRWRSVLALHARELDAFLDAARAVPEAAWHREPAPGKWSAAAVVRHVADSYRFGRDAARSGGGGMRLKVHPLRAALFRHTLFRAMIWLRTFPRGAPAPREVRPDLAAVAATPRAEALAELASLAAEAAEALRAAPGSCRVVHAYFGPLTPRDTLTLLALHTRHHAAGVRARSA